MLVTTLDLVAITFNLESINEKFEMGIPHSSVYKPDEPTPPTLNVAMNQLQLVRGSGDTVFRSSQNPENDQRNPLRREELGSVSSLLVSHCYRKEDQDLLDRNFFKILSITYRSLSCHSLKSQNKKRWSSTNRFLNGRLINNMDVYR